LDRIPQTSGWDVQDFYQCNENALEAAFVPDDVRGELLARLADGYQ
jgi:hypothetical protein